MSSSQIKTYIISFGDVTNNGVKCLNPIIEPAGGQDIAMNCIDPDGCVYKVQVGPNDDSPCLKFIVQCEECDDCGPVVIEKCFCEDQDDCKDCEICGSDGFCEKICDKCCDGQCCDCETDADCPCNKECQNGKCVCPPGTTENANGCCDECQNDGDCPVCHECIFKDGYLQCIPKDCPCDPDGRCGAKGECVECLTSGDCDGVNECCVNCECDCCPGYTRINGVCVECDCQSDTDCDICEVCGSCGCQPQPCPPGEVPTVLNGQCVCVEECDCEDPDCSKRTDYCDSTTVNIDLCGCIPCEGTCASGCIDPCICDPIANKCVYNECEGDCVNGTDCPGRDCGCLDGKCVPCFLLDCKNSDDCERALGCECSPSQKCGPAGCPPTPCSVAANCPFGCTCFEGICVSCDNFSCKTNDCKNQPGCGCVGDSCEGLEEDCADTLTLEKDDDECSLTGTLVKKECCQCPALTMDSRGRIVSETETHYGINFVAEVRKGQYNGGPVENIPKLDDYNNKNIANNEPPKAGSVFMVYEIFYDVYEIIDGVEVRTGVIEREEVSSNPIVFPSYEVTPEQPIAPQATATLNINGFTFPKIGARFESGITVRYVRSVDIALFLSADLQFHNTCRYKGNVQFGDYSITKEQHYKSFPVSPSDYGNARAENITSDACRWPFFKWYKSDTNSFGDLPFRKLYIPPTAGNALKFEDILTTREQGLESCKYYLLETDCTCQGPVSDYIVFCNPPDIDDGTFTGNNILLKHCNTILEFYGPFEPCDPNEDEIYYIEAGSIYVEFGPSDYIGKGAGQLIIPQQTSDYEITEVVYGIVCDTQGICTKTYPVEDQSPEIDVEAECIGNGTITVPFTAPEGCGIAGIQIFPQSQTSGTPIKSYGAGNKVTNLPVGHYTAIISWDCGCDPTTVDFGDDCCGEIVLSDCFRDCITGAVEGCVMEEGVTYYDGNGTQLTYPNGLKTYIAGAALTDIVEYTAQKGQCDPIERSLGAVDGDCCDDYDIKIEPDKFNPNTATVTVTGGFNPSLTVDNGAVQIGTKAVKGPAINEWELTEIPDDTPTLITATDDVCGDISLSYLPGGCILEVSADINPDDCSVVAAVDVQECECPNPLVKVTINAVASDSETYTVTWSTEFMPVDDADPTGGSIEIKYTDPVDNVTTKTETFTGVDQTLKQTVIHKPGLGVSANLQFTAKSVTTEDNCKFADATTSISIANGSGGETKALKLTPKAGTSLDRTTKFTWSRYNASGTAFDLEYIDYGQEDSGVELSIMPINFEVDGLVFLEQGRDYRVEGECVCSAPVYFRYCCLPEVDAFVSGCNNELSVSLTGLDGDYIIYYGGTEYAVTVSGGGGGVIIPSPILWGSGELYPAGASNCREGFSVTLAAPCNFSSGVSTDSCVGDEFSLTISGCNTSVNTLNITGGTYGPIATNASSWVITKVNRNDAVTFTVDGNVTGCVSEEWGPCGNGVTTNCYTPQCAPDVSPSVTPTVSPSINSSPTPTVTRTPSRSPGASPDPTPSNSPPASVTPTVTPTNNPTPSVTGTPGASPTATKSVTPTNTVSPSGTPAVSITPTVTKTPTRTPSVTPTKTVTRSVTPTRTVSRTITPTPTVTPTKSSPFALCNGVPYEPMTRQCCGGGSS